MFLCNISFIATTPLGELGEKMTETSWQSLHTCPPRLKIRGFFCEFFQKTSLKCLNCWMFYRWKTTSSCCTAKILKLLEVSVWLPTPAWHTNVAEKFGFRPKCWPNLFSKAQGVVPKTFQVKEVGKKRGIHRHCQVFDRWRLHGNLGWRFHALRWV